jgi:hypothetical protein
MSEINPVNPEQGNNNYNQNNFNQNSGGTLNTPNSVGALVLGILSIVFCWCYGILAIILGIIALVLANNGERTYKADPNRYTLASYKNLKAGRICAIIGMCLGGLYIIAIIIMYIIFGSLAMGAWNLHY